MYLDNAQAVCLSLTLCPYHFWAAVDIIYTCVVIFWGVTACQAPIVTRSGVTQNLPDFGVVTIHFCTVVVSHVKEFNTVNVPLKQIKFRDDEVLSNAQSSS